MAIRLQPSDVFTPTEAPLELNNVYASRNDAERAMGLAAGRHQIPIVYGEYGVGKTTLVKWFFRKEAEDGRWVHVIASRGGRVEDISSRFLEQFGYATDEQYKDQQDDEVEGETQAGLLGVLQSRLLGRHRVSNTTVSRPSVAAPTLQSIVQMMADERVVLAVDEAHRPDGSFREQLVDLIKIARTLGGLYPQVVVIGTAASASALLPDNEGIRHLVREVRVRPMTAEEGLFLVRVGMDKLELDISDELSLAAVRSAAGAPGVLQEICLDMAETAYRENRHALSDQDLIDAIKDLALAHDSELRSKYISAIETTGARRYRTLILEAMADSDADCVTMSELTTRVSSMTGHPVPASALSGPLRELKDRYGEILIDVDAPGGGRVRNLTSFKEQPMKAYVRLFGTPGRGLDRRSAEVGRSTSTRGQN